MTLLITLTTAEADTGPFNIYSDADGYLAPLAINVSKASLLAGYPIGDAPNSTTAIKIVSIGECKNYIEISVIPFTTTTTSTTTTTTSSSTTTTTTTSLPLVYPVVGTCCGGVVTHYVPYDPAYSIGNVVASITEGFLGGYEITGAAIPGVADLVVYAPNPHPAYYLNCGEFSAYWAGSACV